MGSEKRGRKEEPRERVKNRPGMWRSWGCLEQEGQRWSFMSRWEPDSCSPADWQSGSVHNPAWSKPLIQGLYSVVAPLLPMAFAKSQYFYKDENPGPDAWPLAASAGSSEMSYPLTCGDRLLDALLLSGNWSVCQCQSDVLLCCCTWLLWELAMPQLVCIAAGPYP